MAAEEEGMSISTLVVLLAFGGSLLLIVLKVVMGAARATAALASRHQQQQQQQGGVKGKKGAVAQQQQATEPPRSSKPGGAKAPNLKALIKQSQNAKKTAVSKEDMAAHHALFIATLRGHGDAINGIAWSPDGKLIATACDDMLLRLYDLHDLTATTTRDSGSGGGGSSSQPRDIKFKSHELRATPLGVGFGNDGHSLVVATRGYPDMAVCQLSPHRGAKAGSLAWSVDWEQPGLMGHEQLLDMAVVPAPQAQALGQATGGGVAVLLSTKKDGRVVGLASGAKLAEFAPNSFANHGLSLSADGRFFAVASFTADVKVWEVCWGRTGYNGTNKAMDLKGHSSQVMCVALSPDGGRAITASKDGTMRVWNTAVRYQLQEDPKVLLKADLPLPPGSCFERMAWGPDGTIAAALGGHIHFIDSSSGKVLEVLHAHEGGITALRWSPRRVSLGAGQEPVAVLASASTDRRVRVWRTPARQ